MKWKTKKTLLCLLFIGTLISLIFLRFSIGASTTVGTSTSYYATRMPIERRVFYAVGLFWVFYANETYASNGNVTFQTSADGETWSSPTIIGSSFGGADFSVWLEGSDTLHYVRGYLNLGGLFYRKGTLVSDGSITWAASEQTADTTDPSYDPVICVDSGGYPWIGYLKMYSGALTPHVVKSSTNDGTWSNDTSVSRVFAARSRANLIPVPLTSNQVYAVLGNYNSEEKLYGYLWNGTAWETEETISSSDMSTTYMGRFSSVSINDDIHLVFQKANSDIIYINRTGESWGSELTVQSPYEDYLSYTEVDPNSRINIPNSTHIDITTLHNEIAYLYANKGTDYFGDFIHLIESSMSSLSDSGSVAYIWGLSNNLTVENAWTDGLELFWFRSTTPYLYLRELHSEDIYSDTATTLAYNTTYYLTINKTSTSFTCEIYNNTARTAGYLEDTLNLTLQSDPTFQYIYACSSSNSTGGSDQVDIDIENLQLISMEHASPVLSYDSSTNDLYCFWAKEDDHIYYKKFSSGVWDSAATDWIDESTNHLYRADRLSCSYANYGNQTSLVYMTKTTSPYNVKHNYLNATTPSENGDDNGITPSVSYSNYLDSSDGNCLMYGGIQLKPNTIHTFIPQFNGRYENITLYSGTLGLSKNDYAYNIACSTNDNVTIALDKWFYNDVTQFRPLSEDESTLSFTVNGRNRGEPGGVSGVSSWTYDADTTTVSLTSANYSLVTIRWLDVGSQQLVWYLDRIPMWLGIGGMLMLVLGPVMLVYFGKQDEWATACVWGLICFVIGMGLIIGWLW